MSGRDFSGTTMLQNMTSSLSMRWIKAAVLCGALPILAAVLAMAGFFIAKYLTFTSLQPWTEVGVAIILVGLVLLAVGLVLLGVHVVKANRSGVVGGVVARQVGLTLGLFLVNFPLALVCVMIAGSSIDDVRMRFVNESAVAVEALEVTWPGGTHKIGILAPEQSCRFTFDASREGSVRFTARQDGEDCAGELLGYVHSSMSLTSDVVFDGGCQVRLVER